MRGYKNELDYQEKPPKLNKKIVLNVIVLLVVFTGGFAVGDNKNELLQKIRYGGENQNSQIASELDYTGLDEIYGQLKQSYDGSLEPSKLEDGLKQGLVKAAGDPFTEFLNAEATKEFEEGLAGSFEGIGAELGKEEQSIVIISPIEGFPAKKAGLKAGDIISEINDESAYDISISEAVKKIRGPKGTPVKLGVIRDSEPLEFKIVRGQITIPSVKSEIVEGDIGLIEITRFGTDTTKLAREAALDLKKKNVKGVILDMRGNPGGLLESAVDVAGIWVPAGKTVVEEKRGENTVKVHNSRGFPILQGVRTVVLINEGSASASEIVAGALQDHNAALIIGEKSYGKGSVQEVIYLKDGGSLKVTIARWFTPNGRNIDKEGIRPDKEVKHTEKDSKSNTDPQKDAAARSLRD